MATPTRPIVISLCLTALLAACGGANDKTAAAGAAMPPPEVDVMTVTASSATLTQDLPGRLQAYRTAQVRARVEGVVEKRLFQEGSDVKAGTTLFQIDARTYRAAAEAAKADLMIARQTVERYRPLLEIKAVSQQEYDLAAAQAKQAEAALIRAEEDLENASVPAAISGRIGRALVTEGALVGKNEATLLATIEQLDPTEAALTRAEEDLENASVPAAIPGRIGRALVTEGALVGKNEATLLATIEQLDPIYVNFTQPGADVLRLRQAIRNGKLKRAESASVEMLLEDGSVYPKTGRIFFTDMAVDPDTGAVSLRAEFPNPQRELLPGMFVRLRFPQALADHAIRVPQRAVQAGPQGQFVMVVTSDGKATPQPVKTGGMAGGDFIVVEGLKGGEQVIVNGLQKARAGTPVKAVPVQGNAAPPAANGKP